MKIQDISNTAEFLATMKPEQLKEYAQNNAGNPYLVSLALFVRDQQKAQDRNKQASARPQASVVDTAIENMAPMARASIPAEEVEFEMPEDTGIGQIPIDDTYYGAAGGIVAFGGGGDVPGYADGALVDQIEAANQMSLKTTGYPLSSAQRTRLEQKIESDIAEEAAGRMAGQAGRPFDPASYIPTPSKVGPAVSSAYPDEGQRGPMTGTTPSATPVDGAARMPPAAPRGAAMPSPQPLGIQGLFDEAMGKVAVTDSPVKSQLEALAREKKEASQADTAGLEKIQEKYGDITKGQRTRLDAKEKEIAAMNNQGIGIGLLLYGAELMSKRNPDASVGVKGYLANRDRVAAARDKLSESRDRLEAAEAQRGELNATQLHKLRMNERKVGIEATEDIVKDIKERYNVDRDMALKILDLQIKDAIALRGESRADRRTQMQISAKDKDPKQQIFDQFLREEGGDAVKAQKRYNREFPSTDFANMGRKAGLDAAYKALTEAIASPLPPEMQDKKVAALRKEIQTLSGATPAAAAPSTAAIAALKANPNLAAEFDKKFNGSSAQYLR